MRGGGNMQLELGLTLQLPSFKGHEVRIDII
jgi:hypothetical protein